MKLRKLLLSLSLAGFCFSQASAQQMPQSGARRLGDNATGSTGGVRTIGDTVATSSSKRSTGSGARTVSDLGNGAIPSSTASYASALNMSILAPTACDMGGDCGCSSMSSSCSSGGCDGGCGGTFSSGCGGACGGSATKLWFGGETLLWFSQSQNAPALVTTSAQGVLPIAGATGVTTQVGGADGIETDVLPGFRVEGGMYIGECDKIALSGRAYGIFENNDQYRQSSDGSTSIGIPFFNVNPSVLAEDAYLVAFSAANGAPVSIGSVHVRTDLDMYGAEASLRVLLGRSADHRVDLIGGYTYNKLRSSITLGSESTNLATGDGIPDGTVFNTTDLFSTENEFNGGHVGLLSSVTRRGVSLTTLAKVSFGNVKQSGLIDGFTTEDFGGVAATTAGGILARPSNIGTVNNDDFAFIPELGVKLGYDVNEQLRLTAGYTFMFWSSVAMAGDQIDRVVDLAGTVDRPISNFNNSSFWMQGIDLGFTYTY